MIQTLGLLFNRMFFLQDKVWRDFCHWKLAYTDKCDSQHAQLCPFSWIKCNELLFTYQNCLSFFRHERYVAPGFLSLLGFVYFLPIKCLWSYHTQSILGVLNLFLLGPVFDGNRSLRVTFYTQFFISSETFYSELIHLLFVWLFIAPHNIFVTFFS